MTTDIEIQDAVNAISSLKATFQGPLDGANLLMGILQNTITITTAIQSLAVLGLVGFTATPTDALLTGTALEVRVYP